MLLSDHNIINLKEKNIIIKDNGKDANEDDDESKN